MGEQEFKKETAKDKSGKEKETAKDKSEKEKEWERKTKLFLESSDDDTEGFFQKIFFKKEEKKDDSNFSDLFDQMCDSNVRLDSSKDKASKLKNAKKKANPSDDV